MQDLVEAGFECLAGCQRSPSTRQDLALCCLERLSSLPGESGWDKVCTIRVLSLGPGVPLAASSDVEQDRRVVGRH